MMCLVPFKSVPCTGAERVFIRDIIFYHILEHTVLIARAGFFRYNNIFQ